MAAKKKASTRKTTGKRMWPVATKKADIQKTFANVHDTMNAQGNIGDSMESRLTHMFLGGGTDIMNGQFGYTGEFLQQGIYGGEESGPRGNATLRRYLGGGKDETKLAWLKIKMCREVYDNDGQVASIIDLMADFTTEGINFVHENKGAQNFYRGWAEKVKLANRVRRVTIDLLMSGTVFLYRVYAKLSETEKRAMKRFTIGQAIGNKYVVTDEEGNETLIEPVIQYDSVVRTLLDPDGKAKTDAAFSKIVKEYVKNRIASQGEKIIERNIKEGEKGVVPWKYISLNPLQIRPNEKGGWSYLLSKEDLMQLAGKSEIKVDEKKKTLRVTLPDGLSGTIKPIKNAEATGFFAEMEMSEERLAVVAYNKYDWAKWGGPGGLIWKAMPTIVFKNTLRAMEQKTAKAAINMVYLWKLGNVKEGLIPTLEDYERFADMLKAPAATLNVLWNDAISGEVIQPKLDQIFDEKRWEGLRAELTSQFGITQAIVTGEGGNFSSSFISVQGLLERLQSIRQLLIEEWLLPDALIIQKAMGFQKLPKIVFNQMSLRDKAAENNFLMALHDRGVISDETMFEALDRNVEVERGRLAEQKEFLDEHDMGHKGPFDVNKDQLDFEKEKKASDDEHRDKQFDHTVEMSEKQFEEQKKQSVEQNKMKKEQSKKPPQPKGPGGKPGGKTGPQKKKRESKPKNVARLHVEKTVKELDAQAKTEICQKYFKTDYRSLSKGEKAEVNNTVVSALTEEATNPQACYILYLENRTEFVNNENREPTKAEFHKLLVDSFMEAAGGV
jgi:hypothetical protein